MFKLNRILFISAILLLFSCKTDDDSNSAFQFIGYQYLPLKINQENIYQIDTIRYDDFTGLIDTLQFQRRELIHSTFIDAEQREAYLVNVYRRDNDTSLWTLVKAISRTRTNIRYELLEDNIRTIPLVFPIGENKNWNVNLLNIESDLSVNYKSVHQTFVLDSLTFDSTITIAQRDEDNKVERTFTEDKYAVNVGLVYRKDIDLEIDFNDGSIISGYEATVKLISTNP